MYASLVVFILSYYAGILFEAYTPLGNPGRPGPSKHSDPVLLDDPVVKMIAAKLNATPAQVSVSYTLRRYPSEDATLFYFPLSRCAYPLVSIVVWL